jgi:hypothetical protein
MILRKLERVMSQTRVARCLLRGSCGILSYMSSCRNKGRLHICGEGTCLNIRWHTNCCITGGNRLIFICLEIYMTFLL